MCARSDGTVDPQRAGSRSSFERYDRQITSTVLEVDDHGEMVPGPPGHKGLRLRTWRSTGPFLSRLDARSAMRRATLVVNLIWRLAELSVTTCWTFPRELSPPSWRCLRILVGSGGCIDASGCRFEVPVAVF